MSRYLNYYPLKNLNKYSKLRIQYGACNNGVNKCIYRTNMEYFILHGLIHVYVTVSSIVIEMSN